MVILLVVSEIRLLIRFKNIFIHKDRRRRSSHLLKEVGFRVEFLYENLKKENGKGKVWDEKYTEFNSWRLKNEGIT